MENWKIRFRLPISTPFDRGAFDNNILFTSGFSESVVEFSYSCHPRSLPWAPSTHPPIMGLSLSVWPIRVGQPILSTSSTFLNYVRVLDYYSCLLVELFGLNGTRRMTATLVHNWLNLNELDICKSILVNIWTTFGTTSEVKCFQWEMNTRSLSDCFERHIEWRQNDKTKKREKDKTVIGISCFFLVE